jgi:glycosyltransferase involved in cell wall biosynthesis
VRIAFLVTRSAPIGGVQIHVRDLAAALREEGHSATVIIGGSGAFVDQLRALGIPTIVLQHLSVPIHPLRDLRALGEIRAALRDLRPDLLALHSSKAGILGRIVGRWLGIPAILTAHGWNFTPGIPTFQSAVYRGIERVAGPLASRIIAVSEFDRQLAVDSGLLPANRVITVYNGLADVPPDLRADPGRTPPRLIMVARFQPQKDHATLLRALSGLRDHAWELDLVGDGPLTQNMRSLAGTLGIRDRVRFLGQRSDVAQLLAAAQISLLVTNWEGFPLSILEAMRAGLPVVASSVAGIAESVRDEETGYVVPRGDEELLRDRIRRLLLSPTMRAQLGARGRAHYEQYFTLRHFVGRTLAVYRDVLAERETSSLTAPEVRTARLADQQQGSSDPIGGKSAR